MPTKLKPKQAAKQIENIEYRYKNQPKPTFGYIILNALFSTLIFILFYFFYILQLSWDITQFILIVAMTLISGVIGSAIARMLTGYYDNMWKTSQFYTKTIIAAVIYACIVFFGLYGWIMTQYVDFTTITVAEFLVYMVSRDFLEILFFLLMIKVVVYLFADYMADKWTFGGGS